MDYDVIVIGAGLAGLVATVEIADAGKRVLLLDQEPEASFGGQAWWSFGGLFLINSPEQCRLGIKDSQELAWQDWQGSAGFDREDDEDYWGRKWAEAYVEFASGEKRGWLHAMGIASSQLSAGPNVEVIWLRGMATQYLVFTSFGEQDQASLSRLRRESGRT